MLSPEQIYEAVLQGDMVGCENVVYNVICQLRRKLKKNRDDPGGCQEMVCVYGISDEKQRHLSCPSF